MANILMAFIPIEIDHEFKLAGKVSSIFSNSFLFLPNTPFVGVTSVIPDTAQDRQE
jgi:hypothetical protein